MTTCAHCYGPLPPRTPGTRGRVRKFCSEKCKNDAAFARSRGACEGCGAVTAGGKMCRLCALERGRSMGVGPSERICAHCGCRFQPKPSGWNARYCGTSCKSRSRWVAKPRPSRAGEVTYYSRVVKHDPEKLAAHMARSARGQRATRRWLSEYKMERGCVDCGFNRHPAALQLDHTGEKSADISSLRSSVKRMMTEIEAGECVVRCANCHSIKTWAEKNGLPDPDGHAKYEVSGAT